MGIDMWYEDRRASQERGRKYCYFKRRVCELIGMDCKFSVDGPGDDRDPPDDVVLAELEKRLKR